jgi:N-sulfoglucosamine sulfohydrolase
MRCVQNGKYGYIYNPFSDGKHRYRNNNEGLTMKAMNEAAETNPEIAARVQLFRYRVPEEFYDLEYDPDCLHNLIDDPDRREDIQKMRDRLQAWMEKTNDPMLEAFKNRTDREIVDRVMVQTYGSLPGAKAEKKKAEKREGRRNQKRKKGAE